MNHRPVAFLCTVLVAWLLLTAAASAAAAGPGTTSEAHYHLVRTVPLGAPDRWDYLIYDAPSHHVYISHADRISVVDGHNGRLIGEVRGMPGGTHGIAIAHTANLGFTDDRDANQAVAFNLSTLKVVKRLKTDDGADAVTYDPTSGHVLVVDGDPGTLTVIDPGSGSVMSTVHVGSKLEYIVSGGNGKLYVNGVVRRLIYRIDTTSNQVDATWPISECESPHGLAVDTATHRLFASCENQRLVVVNADTGEVVRSLPIGRGSDAVAFDPSHKLVLSSNGLDGNISVIREVDANTFESAGTIRTMLSARTMSVDPRTGRLFVVGAETTPKAMQAFITARQMGKQPGDPFKPGSLRLMFYDPGR